MMPGTIAERRTEQVTESVVSAVDVADLSGTERVVALYESDMRNRRNCTPDQLSAWIVQGAERLGVEELQRRARFAHGHALLEQVHVVPPAVQARHEQTFPNRSRLQWAGQMAANSLWRVEMTDTARSRDREAEVDGECPCRGTRSIYFSDWDPDLSFSMMCPVHARALIDAHYGVGR
jgi:hypothetical protein